MTFSKKKKENAELHNKKYTKKPPENTLYKE